MTQASPGRGLPGNGSGLPKGDSGDDEGPLGTPGEQFQAIEQGLAALHSAPGDLGGLKALFRGLHTLSGVAGFQELEQAKVLASAGEKVLEGLRDGRVGATPQAIELLFRTAELLRILVAHAGSRMHGQDAWVETAAAGLITRLNRRLEVGTDPDR
jgi:chemotaxis protein histidine kinase CheA